MKRATRKKLPKGIRKLPNGQYLVDIRDSQNKRHRKQHDTQDQAVAYRDDILQQKATGEFLATSANTTFGQLLDMLIEAKTGTVSEGRVSTLQSMCSTLKSVFGARPLADFDDQQNRFVQEWLDTAVLSQDYRENMRTLINMAFKLAVQREIVRQHPSDKWPLTVRRDDEDAEDDVEEKVLAFEQLAAIVAASKARADREKYLVAGMRHMLVMIMLFTGMRPQAACGLCWDCTDLDERRIYVRRKVLRSGKLVRGTKIGKGGFRTLPMSPPLHAALLEWRDRLSEQGFPTEGAVPVLRTLEVEIVNPHDFSSGAGRPGGHWSSIARRAKLVDPNNGAIQFTAYCLRHTAGNMWRAIGLDIEDVRSLMTHQTIQTTIKHYLHHAPHLAVLRREVDRVIAEFHLDRTVEARVDALGIVLARRLQDAGVKIPCSLPHAANVLDHPGLAIAALPAPSNVVELRKDQYTIATPESEPITPPVTGGIAAFRNWQFSEIKRMRAAGHTKAQIIATLRVSESTIAEALRSADELRDLHALPKSERRGIRKRCQEHFESGRHTTYRDIGLAEGVRPMMVRQWAMEDGWRAQHGAIGRPRKLVGPVVERIVELHRGGMSATAISRVVGLADTTVSNCLRTQGLLPAKADRKAVFDEKKGRIRKHIEAGKSARWIAAAEGVSTATVTKVRQELKESCGSSGDEGTEWTVDPAESA